MSGVLEQPAVHGRSTYGAVVLALAPAGAAPGPADTARAGDDAAPVPIRPAGGVLHPRHEAGAAELFARLRAEGVLTALVTTRPELGAGPPADIVVAADPPRDGTAGRDGPDPHPPAASLLLASRRLAVEPEHIVVVSDSDRLVRTAVTHGFGLVVGLDGAGRRGRLLAAGAHLVVDDLTDLDIPVATPPEDSDWAGGCGGGSPWNLTYADLDPPREGMRESLCTLGNGYMAVRGAASHAGDSVRGAVGNVGDGVRHGADRAVEKAKGNPLAVGLIAFGVFFMTSLVVVAMLQLASRENPDRPSQGSGVNRSSEEAFQRRAAERRAKAAQERRAGQAGRSGQARGCACA